MGCGCYCVSVTVGLVSPCTQYTNSDSYKRLYPKGLLCDQSARFMFTQELGALSIWLASRMQYCSLSFGRLLYIAPSSSSLYVVLHLGIRSISFCVAWANETAEQVSRLVTCQAACVALLHPYRQCAKCQACHDHVGVTNLEHCTP